MLSEQRVYFGLLVFCGYLCIGLHGRGTNSSNQHKLLTQLFDSYNKRVRPVDNDSLPIVVGFEVRLRKVMKVDSKAQQMTVSVWVTQFWKNSFLVWEPTNVGGLSSIAVDPSEIWTPDVGLMNNADETVSVAGGKTKFQTNIIVSNNGLCTWRSPATFISDCEIKVRYWPFDAQKCSLVFSSYTMTQNQLSLVLRQQNSKKSDKFATNGEWTVNEITIDKADQKRSCCPKSFSVVGFNINLHRKPQYFVLNVIAPSVILCFLTFVSFGIPSESGERIGFITTLLLAMTVYLLLIADILPETSNQIPITGLLFVLTIGENAFILVATIIVLRCYHGTGEPPIWLQRFYCCCCPCTKKNASFAKVIPNDPKTNGIEMNGGPSDIPAVFNIQKSQEYETPTWHDISIFLNRVFFVLSVLVVLATFAAIYTTAALIDVNQ